jgi:hypothetical protein
MKWPCSGPNVPSAVPSTSNRRSSACVQGTYCGGWRRCACLDAETRVLAVRALASTTCNNFIADLLFLSEVSHSLLVAGAPCVHPYLGKWALVCVCVCVCVLGGGGVQSQGVYALCAQYSICYMAAVRLWPMAMSYLWPMGYGWAMGCYGLRCHLRLRRARARDL